MMPLAYTWAALAAIVAAVVVDTWVLRTKLLRTKLFWASYGIILFFQLIVNGILTGLNIVRYHPDVILGLRVVNAPVEDIGFGFGLVCLTLIIWVKLVGDSSRSAANPNAPRSSGPRS